jgi:hypothetical protein
MTRKTRMVSHIAIAILVGASCLLVSERAVLNTTDTLMATAEARIGRPLTPLSYAGVARRTTRRAVAYGAAAGAAAAAAAPRCVQQVDAYGRIYTRCY